MSNLQQVSINESTEEENISLEDQAAAQEEANAGKPEEQEAAQTQEETRPEWLPEKFESAEDLAKAYGELEKKGAASKKEAKQEAKQETKQEGATVDTDGMRDSVAAATHEFMEKGEISEDTFSSLEKAGLPSEVIEAYMAGQSAIADNQATAVKNSIGGEGNYEAMAEWATDNVSEEDLNAYNEIVETGTVDQARMAVRGMFSQFKSAGGKAPSLLQGATQGSGVKAFASAAQVTEAMRDARYKKDPAYRANVEQRLAVTTAF